MAKIKMSRCPECGARYSPNGGGHCRGGAYGGCCRTFSSDAAADAHRKGPYGVPGGRYCVDFDADYTEKGRRIEWRLTDRGWTNSPPMDPAALARRKGTPATVDRASQSLRSVRTLGH